MATGPTASRPSAATLLGVQRRPKNARDRLLDAAIELFYAHGFNAIGLDRVIADVGCTKTTFYKHFSGKDELIVEAVRMRDAWEAAAWARAVRELAGDDPRERLLGYFRVMDIWFNDPDFRGCLFINVAAEFPNPHDPVHEVAAEHKRRMRSAFRDLAAAAGLRDPEAFADEYTMLLEGAIVLRHVHGRDDAAQVALGAVRRLIAAHAAA